MEKHLPDSIFVFEVKELCCVPCMEEVKKSLLKRTGNVEVDADLEKKTVTIKGNIDIVKLLTMFKKTNLHADLIYYKRGRREDHDQQKESCDKEENNCSCDTA